jgi:hypothetical protein
VGRDQRYDFFKFHRKKLAKKLAFLTQIKGNFAEKVIMAFEKNANFFAENWQKSHKNCDHNIGPRLGDCLYLRHFLKNTKVAQIFVQFFARKKVMCNNFDKKWIGRHIVRFLKTSSDHPVAKSSKHPTHHRC